MFSPVSNNSKEFHVISLLFLFSSSITSSVVESNKCIDVSFICRHFGDCRGLIKSEVLRATVEMLFSSYSCYKIASRKIVSYLSSVVSRMETFSLWSRHNQFLKLFYYLHKFRRDSVGTIKTVGKKLKFLFPVQAKRKKHENILLNGNVNDYALINGQRVDYERKNFDRRENELLTPPSGIW